MGSSLSCGEVVGFEDGPNMPFLQGLSLIEALPLSVGRTFECGVRRDGGGKERGRRGRKDGEGGREEGREQGRERWGREGDRERWGREGGRER